MHRSRSIFFDSTKLLHFHSFGFNFIQNISKNVLDFVIRSCIFIGCRLNCSANFSNSNVHRNSIRFIAPHSKRLTNNKCVCVCVITRFKIRSYSFNSSRVYFTIIALTHVSFSFSLAHSFYSLTFCKISAAFKRFLFLQYKHIRYLSLVYVSLQIVYLFVHFQVVCFFFLKFENSRAVLNQNWDRNEDIFNGESCSSVWKNLLLVVMNASNSMENKLWMNACASNETLKQKTMQLEWFTPKCN